MKSSGGASSAGAYDSKNGRSAGAGRGGAGMSGNSDQVKAIQQALKDQGHDPGDIDGIMGPKTQAALRDYQQKQGLKSTGRLDAETSAKLGVEAKTSAAPSSSGSPAASPSTSAPASSDTKAKADTGMKSDSMKSDSSTKSGNKADTSAKPSDTKQK